MPDETDRLFVKTHVARDLLQIAELFADVPKATWEYIVNGLEYVDPGTQPRVEVVARTEPRRLITVFDRGRGMGWEGLKNYFVMHAENQDRAKGTPGRGRFGTGKSAAFGIATCLTVTTRKNGKQSKVRLTRHDIEKMSSRDVIPVKVIEREKQTDTPNGTVVEIDDILSTSAKRTLQA
jgi:Molecular chaperone, HSP90 family